MNTGLRPFRGPLAFTVSLVVIESVGWLLFPLVIGRAIDSAVLGSGRGIVELVVLSVATVGVDVLRRVYDSRAYAKVYVKMSEELAARQSSVGTSAKTARLGMLGEVVEFFENSLPTLVSSVLGLVGTVAILSALSLPIFAGCMIVVGATVAVYGSTGRFTMRWNEAYNNEYERRVEVVESGSPARIARHVRRMMRWNVKLSDLEAANFGVLWVLMVGLLAYSVRATATDTVEYGGVVAVVMYVFEFMESVVMLPLFYQQWLRLREIVGRLAEAGGGAGAEDRGAEADGDGTEDSGAEAGESGDAQDPGTPADASGQHEDVSGGGQRWS